MQSCGNLLRRTYLCAMRREGEEPHSSRHVSGHGGHLMDDEAGSPPGPIDTNPATAFAWYLETACAGFETLLDLIDKRVHLAGTPAVGSVSVRTATIRMALVQSFIFNGRRANRLCETKKDFLPLDRIQRRLFMNGTDPLTHVRDVNEHGYEGGHSSPSLHFNGGGWIDETGLNIHGRDAVLIGPLNLSKIYPVIDRARKLAGFNSLADRIAKPVLVAR
ncbi:hypothetical protein AB7M42_004747 [Bradyrhizobium diazoefficiens]